MELGGNRDGVVNIEAVGPASALRIGRDVVLAVMVDEHVSPHERIAGVMTAAVIELGQVTVKITEECLETEVVGQCDTEVATELIGPVVQNCSLGQVQGDCVDALVKRIEFVGERTDCLAAALDGQVHVGCANESRAAVNHVLHHVLVPVIIDGTADTEIGNGKLHTPAESGIPLGDRFAQGRLGCIPVNFEVIEIEVLDDFEDIDFKPRRLKCRDALVVGGACPNMKTAIICRVLLAVDILALQLEILKNFDKIVGKPRHDPANALDFPFSETQCAEVVELTVDFVIERSQVHAGGPELELPVRPFVAALVEHKLGHTELVGVRLGQVVRHNLLGFLRRYCFAAAGVTSFALGLRRPLRFGIARESFFFSVTFCAMLYLF